MQEAVRDDYGRVDEVTKYWDDTQEDVRAIHLLPKKWCSLLLINKKIIFDY